jgi:hypothetical protein
LTRNVRSRTGMPMQRMRGGSALEAMLESGLS